MTERGDGKTTRAMQAAPRGAVYIWCNGYLDYPTELARKLGRIDLKIVRPVWLERRMYLGLELTGLVVDHAAQLDRAQFDRYREALARVRQPSEAG